MHFKWASFLEIVLENFWLFGSFKLNTLRFSEIFSGAKAENSHPSDRGSCLSNSIARVPFDTNQSLGQRTSTFQFPRNTLLYSSHSRGNGCFFHRLNEIYGHLCPLSSTKKVQKHLSLQYRACWNACDALFRIARQTYCKDIYPYYGLHSIGSLHWTDAFWSLSPKSFRV